jgi:carboxypeptidase C (cathepsin A)
MKNFTSLLFYFLLIFASIQVYAADSTQSKKNYQYPPASVTKHSITLGGQKINYTAKAGHMLTLNSKGEKKGLFFHVAYTRDGLETSKRPITFVFNGGPGSSSVWLHMGALGPKRVAMKEDGTAINPPYAISDNEHCWLDKTDLVFIDPIETGYSRPAEDVDKKEFTGYNEDIESIGDFIHKYVSQEGRWASPKYLAGESYGTTRAVGLSGYLQDRHGMYLNGLVLISAVLNFQTLHFSSGNDLPYALFVPSYAASAYFHGKINKQKFPDYNNFLKEVEAFALGEFTLALAKGDKLSTQEKNSIAQKLSDYTGLSVEFLLSYHLRISTGLFTKELLRQENYSIGRFDATIKARDKQQGGSSNEFDPSYNLSIFGAYTMAINEHLKQNLKFENPDMVYEILTGKVHPWNYSNVQNRYLENAEVLRSAIHKNPSLKVLVCNGYYDLATPYFATEYTLNHMFLAPEYQSNIRMKYYQGGHMMYTFPSQIGAFTKDVRDFYDGK